MTHAPRLAVLLGLFSLTACDCGSASSAEHQGVTREVLQVAEGVESFDKECLLQALPRLGYEATDALEQKDQEWLLPVSLPGVTPPDADSEVPISGPVVGWSPVEGAAPVQVFVRRGGRELDAQATELAFAGVLKGLAEECKWVLHWRTCQRQTIAGDTHKKSECQYVRDEGFHPGPDMPEDNWVAPSPEVARQQAIPPEEFVAPPPIVYPDDAYGPQDSQP